MLYRDGECASPRSLAMFLISALALINIIALLQLGDYFFYLKENFLGLHTFVHSTLVRVLIAGILCAVNYFIFLHDNKYEIVVTKMDVAYQRRRIAENVLFWGTVLFSLSLLAIGEYASGNTSWLN